MRQAKNGGQRIKKLRPAGARHDFLQNGVNFLQQVAGLHAAGKNGSVETLPAGAFHEGADFKIELIIWFLGHWFHFRYHDLLRSSCQMCQEP